MKIFAKTVENEALEQLHKIEQSPLAENAHIRIMPDCHAGAGCVIGTTMRITDKVCPNIVGVDIGCGVNLVKTDINFANRLDELDEIIRRFVPFGMACHEQEKPYDFSKLRCYSELDDRAKSLSQHALGTLGGGNHFIEAYDAGYLSVHSGSRNIGCKVADYYQKTAIKQVKKRNKELLTEQIKNIEPSERQSFVKANKIFVSDELCYLHGDLFDDYMHDIAIMQQFATDNREAMLRAIVKEMSGNIESVVTSTHNYIDTDNMILRKGAVSAKKDEILVIPLNMRDGVLLCKGKGNEDWNCSAPHGAGRLYSRTKAKQAFTVKQYQEAMIGIYSTSINESTLDEAPFAYKCWKEIVNCIEPTVDILERLMPIFNFKAND